MTDRWNSGIWFLLVGLAALYLVKPSGAAELDILWNSTVLTLDPAPQNTTARGRYTFINNGDAPVTVESIQSTCGCTAAETSDAPEDGQYAPGASGHIDVEISFARGGGEIRKNIYVTLRCGSETTKQKLTIAVDARPYLTIKPRAFFWTQNEPDPEAKTAMLEVKRNAPIHLIRVEKSGDAESFTVEQATVAEGKKYRISVRPRNTKERRNIALTLVTDFPSETDPLTYKVTASIAPKITIPRSRDSGLAHLFAMSPATQATIGVLVCVIGGGIIGVLILRLSSGTTSGGNTPPNDEDS